MVLKPGHDTVSASFLVDDLINGGIKIPDLQRDFVWSDEKVRQLAESMLKGYPIGMLTFFNMGNISYVLDGQQRLLSLVLIKKGVVSLRNERQKTVNLWFNVNDGSIKVTRSVRRPGIEWVNVPSVLDKKKQEIPDLARKIEEELIRSGNDADYIRIRENLLMLWDTFNGEYRYQIPVYVASPSLGIEELGEIFVRINFAGTRIRAADIYMTMLEVSMPGLATKIREMRQSLLNRWLGEKWDLDYGTFVKTFIAFLTDGRVKIANTVLRQANELKKILKEKSASQINVVWNDTKKAITEAINLMRQELRISGTNSWLFLSESPVITMAYYLRKRNFSISDNERKGLIGWLLIAQFFHRYTSAPDTKLNEDLTLANSGYKALADKIWEFAAMRGITEEAFSGKVTGKGSNLLMLLLALLQSRQAKDFYKHNVNIDDTQDINVHHIFPASKIPSDFTEDEVHDIANVTFTLSSTNKSIGETDPKMYLSDIPPYILEQHLIPDKLYWDISRYREFLAERRKMLVVELNNYLKKLNVL